MRRQERERVPRSSFCLRHFCLFSGREKLQKSSYTHSMQSFDVGNEKRRDGLGRTGFEDLWSTILREL